MKTCYVSVFEHSGHKISHYYDDDFKQKLLNIGNVVGMGAELIYFGYFKYSFGENLRKKNLIDSYISLANKDMGKFDVNGLEKILNETFL
jgi:hypothetical protein